MVNLDFNYQMISYCGNNPSVSCADKSLRRFRSAALTVHRTVIHYRRHRFANPLHKGALGCGRSLLRCVHCVGRHFLVSTRKYPKNRLRGGLSCALRQILSVVPGSHGTNSPSPKNPSAATRSRDRAVIDMKWGSLRLTRNLS